MSALCSLKEPLIETGEKYCKKSLLYIPYAFRIQSYLKRSLTSLLLNFAFDHAIRKAQDNTEGMELNGIRQLLIYADYVI